jgi:hypothetical protein
MRFVKVCYYFLNTSILKIDYDTVTKYPNKESKRGSNSLIKGWEAFILFVILSATTTNQGNN